MTKLTTIIIILSILYIIILSIDHQINNKHLHGFWKASPEFCQAIGADNMIFYIDDIENEVHITIETNGYTVEDTRFIMNKSIDYSDPSNYIPFNNLFGNQTNRYNLQLVNEDEDNDWVGKQFTLNFSPIHNAISLILDDKIYAQLYKDPCLTMYSYKYMQEE